MVSERKAQDTKAKQIKTNVLMTENSSDFRVGQDVGLIYPKPNHLNRLRYPNWPARPNQDLDLNLRLTLVAEFRRETG